jgi:hypothetical protein
MMNDAVDDALGDDEDEEERYMENVLWYWLELFKSVR